MRWRHLAGNFFLDRPDGFPVRHLSKIDFQPYRYDSMTSNPSDLTKSTHTAIRARVLRGIAANRIPGLHFAGHFLGLEWREVTQNTTRVTLAEGPHCRDADGTMNLVALGILADHMLATPARIDAVAGARLGTIHLQLQFTGAPLVGDLSAEARLLGRSEGTALQQSLASGTISANNRTVCFASGEFVFLDPPPGVSLGPLPWQRSSPPRIEPVDDGKLDPSETAILKACDAALEKRRRRPRSSNTSGAACRAAAPTAREIVRPSGRTSATASAMSRAGHCSASQRPPPVRRHPQR